MLEFETRALYWLDIVQALLLRTLSKDTAVEIVASPSASIVSHGRFNFHTVKNDWLHKCLYSERLLGDDGLLWSQISNSDVFRPDFAFASRFLLVQSVSFNGTESESAGFLKCPSTIQTKWTKIEGNYSKRRPKSGEKEKTFQHAR